MPSRQGDTRKERQVLQARQRAAEKADKLIRDGKDENALKYLLLTKRAERAVDPLQKQTRLTNCAEVARYCLSALGSQSLTLHQWECGAEKFTLTVKHKINRR